MRFIELQQAGLVGTQRILVNADAISYVQEVSPEQGALWPAAAGPARALLHLAGIPNPLAVLEPPEEIAARANGVAPPRRPRSARSARAKASSSPKSRDT